MKIQALEDALYDMAYDVVNSTELGLNKNTVEVHISPDKLDKLVSRTYSDMARLIDDHVSNNFLSICKEINGRCEKCKHCDDRFVCWTT